MLRGETWDSGYRKTAIMGGGDYNFRVVRTCSCDTDCTSSHCRATTPYGLKW